MTNAEIAAAIAVKRAEIKALLDARICSVDGCIDNGRLNGLCERHYDNAWHRDRYVPTGNKPGKRRCE